MSTVRNPDPGRKSRLLSGIPDTCGVYIFRNELESVLYVGKAVNLRRRVMQYFARAGKHPEEIKDSLADYIACIEWIPCETELHALLLEDLLIKRHRPPYNRKLKKCLQYAYIGVSDGPFPELIVVRSGKIEPFAGKGELFGPYNDEFAAVRLVDIIRKYLPIRSCSGPLPSSVCIRGDLGVCLGPCEGRGGVQEYAGLVRQAKGILAGSDLSILDRIAAHMKELSDTGLYEQAARVREELYFTRDLVVKMRFYSDFRNGILLLHSGGRWQGTFLFMKGELVLYSPLKLDADACLSRLPVSWDGEPAPDAMLFDRAAIVSAWSNRRGEDRTCLFLDRGL